MGKKNFDWFRLYSSEFLSDKKLRRIAVATGEDLATVRGVYVALLCLANESPDRDGHIALTEGLPALADEILPDLGLPAKRAELILAEMDTMINMLDRGHSRGWLIRNFAARQTYSDTTNADRQAKWRAKQKEKKRSRGDGPTGKATPAKDKRSTMDRGHPDVSDDSTPADRLAQTFADETGFWGTADPTTDAEHWTGPAQVWLDLVDGDEQAAADLMRAAIQYHRENQITFTRPSSLTTVINKIHNQTELKVLWKRATDLMLLHGANNEPQDLDGDLAKIIKAAGGWKKLCGLNTSVAKEKFGAAYGLMRSHGRRINKAGRS
jgi:hypothetical protein